MRPIRALFLAAVSAIVAVAIAYAAVIRPWVRGWGADEADADAPLPGDDLVAEPTAAETRAVNIAAPVAAVWPWLAQMGDGRGGWYSFESRDGKMTSAESILPDFQSIAVGDTLSVADGGVIFVVKSVEPQASLVLYTDSSMVRPTTTDEDATNKRRQIPEFKVSWGFYIKPTDDGGTRLIERFRAYTPATGSQMPVIRELMGTGIILMARKQMLAIKERAERAQFGKLPDAARDGDAITDATLTGSHEPHIDIPDVTANDALPELAAAI